MKKVLVVFAVLGLVLGVSGVALADGPKLQFQSCYLGSPEIGWVQGPDSPSDGNSSALSIRTDGTDGVNFTDYECALAANVKYGLHAGSSVGVVKNLSFEYLDSPAGYVGGGAPRFSVDLDTDGNGSYDITAFLAASGCHAQIGTSGWSRADFTGRTAPGCTITMNSGSETFSSDGTHTAFKNLALAHPTWKLFQEPYFIVDEETAGPLATGPGGRVLADRIAIQNKMQQAKGNVKNCKNEAAC